MGRRRATCWRGLVVDGVARSINPVGRVLALLDVSGIGAVRRNATSAGKWLQVVVTVSVEALGMPGVKP